ncbi:MAG: FecR domain-containing protein, partial [Acidobacteriota bacterium]|nr:FecR domain-containing protein [Acidobacteriota bacterium]
MLIAAIVLSLTYLVFPEVSSKVIQAVENAVSPASGGVATRPVGKQARFVNLDGKVQVKKANSVQWASADYQITLDKGDLIQTGPEGVARIVFADGTTYTVKGDTLVTVEENIVNQNSATQVGVHITSGQVDLLTGSWPVAGSKAQVSFENAVASVNANSRAAVVSDPQHNEQQITID